MVVFYQGPGRWRHATEFAELFADSIRDWPWVPRFAHLLVDQSRENPQAVRGLWATQDRDTARRFGQQLRATVSGSGGDLVTYAEELMQEMARKVRAEGLQQGRSEGLLEGQVGTIESLLRAGVRWPVIEAATGIDRDALRALRQRLEGPDEGTREAD